MAEDIKYVEEAPESQPSVREKLAWVPGYPRDRLDEFLDNIALLVNQAREQASLAETRAAQATLEAYNAAGARQVAEASALEGLGYKQSASKSAGDSATEADRSSDEADRAKEEADRVLHDLAVHTENPEAHPQYVKAALPVGTTLEQQFAWTLEGWRSVVSGDKVRCFAPASNAVAGSLQLDEALGWNDPVLAEDGDYIMLYTDMVGGPEQQSPVVGSGGWWFVSTREISSDYFVQMMYNDYGDTCTRCFTVSRGESGPLIEPGDGWQILAKSDFYYTERFQNANRATTGTPSVRKITKDDLANNSLYHTNTAIKAFELPSGNVNGFSWYGGGVWFTVSNMTAEPVNIIGVESAVINGVIGLASEIDYESNHQVIVPPWCTARIRSLYPNNWVVSVERADGGTAEPVNKPPVFLDNASVPISNYAKHRIMRVNGLESEGVDQLFSLPVEGEGWIDISVDHTWKTNARGELLTSLVLVAPAGETISTNDGDFAAVRILYRNDLTAFRYEGQWRINDCVEYELVGPVTKLTVSSIVWTTQTETSSLMQNLKQIPSYPNGEFWWIAWNDTHYQVSRTVNSDTHDLFPRTLVYLTNHDLVTPKIQCLTVHWSESEGPIFYAIVESAGGGSVYLAEGKMNIGAGSGVITWNSIGVFAAKFQSIVATDAGFVVAIGDDGSSIYELKYHPVGIGLTINTYPSTNASNSNHDWKFAEVIKGKAGSGSVYNTKTVTLLDGTETTWFYKSTDEAVFSTTDGVAVMLYAFPETGYEVTMTHNQLYGPPYSEVFQSFCFDYYQSCACYGRDSNTEMIWYRSTTTKSSFETNFVGSSGKYGIRMMQMEWGLSAETLPVFVAMIGDEFNIGLCPTFDHHYYSTRGQKPGADAGVYLPDYVATEHYAVPAFGATWSYNPNRIREDNFRFYYRRAKAGSDAYEVVTGNDLGTTEGMLEAGIINRG